MHTTPQEWEGIHGNQPEEQEQKVHHVSSHDMKRRSMFKSSHQAQKFMCELRISNDITKSHFLSICWKCQQSTSINLPSSECYVLPVLGRFSGKGQVCSAHMVILRTACLPYCCTLFQNHRIS